jgi:hypothetical protein
MESLVTGPPAPSIMESLIKGAPAYLSLSEQLLHNSTGVFTEHAWAMAKAGQIWAKLERGDTVRVVAVGGSPTAIGDYMKQFGERVRQVFNTTAKLVVSNMGHGNRGSMFTAPQLDSFVPSNTDIILWEFSINDEFRRPGKVADRPNSADGVLPISYFLAKAMALPNPPIVILSYLWNYPMLPRPVGSVFAHSKKARSAFPNVLGYVNLAEVVTGGMQSKDYHYILRDTHHPSLWGNKLWGHLLAHTLLNSFKYVEKGAPVPTLPALPPIEALGNLDADLCGRDREKQMTFVFDTVWPLMVQRSPPISYTEILPRLPQDVNSIMQHLSHMKNSEQSDTDVEMLGKASGGREDRQNVRLIPQCTADGQLKGMMSFGVRKDGVLQDSTNVDGLILNFNAKSMLSLKIALVDVDGKQHAISAGRGPDGFTLANLHAAGYCSAFKQIRCALVTPKGFPLKRIHLCGDGGSNLEFVGII